MVQLQPQQIPTSWGAAAPGPAPATSHSPFLNSYTSPMPTNQARAQQQQAPQHSQFPPVGGGNNPDAGKMGNSIEINKKSESLRKITGNPADIIDWSNHFIDHMAKVHISWRYTLEWISKTQENLSMSRLRADWLGPYRENAHDLAVKL